MSDTLNRHPCSDTLNRPASTEMQGLPLRACVVDPMSKTSTSTHRFCGSPKYPFTGKVVRLTRMKLSGVETGLLINFNVQRLADGIDRLKLSWPLCSLCFLW